MAKGFEVLAMLLPDGGWTQVGDDFEGIEFIECDPITKKQYEDGFAKYDAWKLAKDSDTQSKRSALLNRLGITDEEAKLLLE